MFTWLLELFKIPEIKHIKNTKDIDDVQTTVIVPKIVTEFLKGIKRMRKNGIPEIPD